MKRLALVLALVVAVGACSAQGGVTSPSPVVTIPTPSATPTLIDSTVNGQPISQAKPCDSYVGQTLTKASETMICSDPDGTGETSFIQPAGATVCTNGETFISVSATVGGIEGQKAAKYKADSSLDRDTCRVTEN